MHMETIPAVLGDKKFQTPEEEISFLREALRTKEDALRNEGVAVSRDAIAKETIKEYKETPVQNVLPEERIVPEAEHEKVVLRLRPENHDKKMEELFGMLMTHGLKNTLLFIEKLNNPHLDDDFHRFLVQYLYSVGPVPGLVEGTPIFKALRMSLFEVTIPEGDGKDGQKTFKEFLGAMEQFLAGMQSIVDTRDNEEKTYITLEIANPAGTNEVAIYASVPRTKADLFEKQIISFYPGAKVRELSDDYNIFVDGSFAAGSESSFAKEEIYPIKTHDLIDHDPMQTILNAFSKLDKVSEGAAIQFTVMPAGERYIKKFSTILKSLQEGSSLKDALAMHDPLGKALLGAGKSIFLSAFKSKDGEEKKDKKMDDIAIHKITEKLKNTIMLGSVRVIASAQTKPRAESILNEMSSAFNQFSDTTGNSLVFEKITDKDLQEFFHAYSYRLVNEKKLLPLNLRELASLFHFPVGVGANPQLKQAKAGSSPAPVDMATEGILLGHNNFRGVSTPVHMKSEDRMRHFYVIGQTGTGKTVILKNMIAQDIANGDGCCFIDPHGTDIQDILSYVPKERIDDVIYFDPAYIARPMGLNMLEFDPRFPEQKTMVIDTLLSIFNQLFDMKTAGGPMFEQYFKNSALLVMEHPESGSTLLEISRVLVDKEFREMKLSHCKNPIIKQFWVAAEATKGDQGLENFVPYLTSKFDIFISNEFMRPVVLQQNSVLNFRDIMDNKKILLVNLSKGRLGELNANLIGMLVVMKFQMAALSRVDSYGQKLSDFYLYIDEFQNVTTPAIASILSEARKYRLSLNLAHQYISQLPEDIKGAVFGNVGSMAVFRISPEDAQYMEPKFAPTFTAKDITRLDNYNAYMSMIINGAPSLKPFNIATVAPRQGNKEIVPQLKELSYLKYGRDRDEVEAEVFARYNKSNG